MLWYVFSEMDSLQHVGSCDEMPARQSTPDWHHKKPGDVAATTSTQIVSGGSPAWILPALYRSWC